MMATPTVGGPAPAWRITSQAMTTRAAQGGQFTRGTVVSFTTRNGHTGEVFVPENVYRPDVVAQMVSVAARTMDDVGALQG